MAVARPAILLRAAYRMPQRAFVTVDGVNALSASGGATGAGVSTLIDAGVAPPLGFAATTHKNWFVYRYNAAVAGDRRAIVSSYSGANRAWSVQETYANGPATDSGGAPYMVLKDDPDLWAQALNEALREECFFIRYKAFTPTDATKFRYDLAAAPLSVTAGDITRRSQIVGLDRHLATEASGAERWKTWANGYRVWDIEEQEGTYYLDTLGHGLNTADQMRLVYTMPYSPLTDETTTSGVDIDWASWATLLVMGRWFGDQNNTDDEWEVMRRKAQAECDVRGRLQLGRYRYRVVDRHSTPSGGAFVGGRRGTGGGARWRL